MQYFIGFFEICGGGDIYLFKKQCTLHDIYIFNKQCTLRYGAINKEPDNMRYILILKKHSLFITFIYIYNVSCSTDTKL